MAVGRHRLLDLCRIGATIVTERYESNKNREAMMLMSMQIKNMRRYECSSCPDYDLCEECFTSSMLRHRHPKQQFVARS